MNPRIVLAGGNSGIGEVLRARLAPASDLICFSRSQEPPVDVTAEEPAFPAVEGPVHGLVYCPGSITLKPFRSLGPEQFRADLEVNLLGAVRTLRHYLPNLQQADAASVVLFSTVAVQSGMPFHASIAAAKGAVEGLTRSLAAEFAPKIRVNAVAPSLMETPLASGLLKTDRQREAMAARHPLKRIGNAEDVAAAAQFLLSAESGWITGEVIPVTGGLSALRPT